MRGKFITLEGIDGAGKSTHLEWIADWVRTRGHPVVVTREPGGTPLGEMLRDLLLTQPMHRETETLLIFAARREHLDKVIQPAMEKGHWVICDRFTDATFAYQGGGRGIARAKLELLEQWVQDGLQPDLTFLFDVTTDVSRARLALNLTLDRFEQEQEAFFQRVREAYLERARAFPQRIRVVDGNRPIPAIRQELEGLLQTLCP